MKLTSTTDYDPTCSEMQEVEYTIPMSKRDIVCDLKYLLDQRAKDIHRTAEREKEIKRLKEYVLQLEITVQLLNKHKEG